jgi:GntR family transcriptional regulator
MHTHDQVFAVLRIEATGVPIYVQLRDQFLRVIAVGLLRPGDQMPTMRQVAVALKVDLNTVRHAYEELEKKGAVTLERGRGSFVAARSPRGFDPDLIVQTETLARQTLAAAAAMGIDPKALADRITTLATQKETTE